MKICSQFLFPLCLLISTSSKGACVTNELLWSRLLYIRDQSTDPADRQLQELLSYQDQLKTCPGIMDSTRAFLLERIGLVYFKLANYESAITRTRAAIDILQARGHQSLVYQVHLMDCYFNLSFYYDQLMQIKEKKQALDKSISIGMKANIQQEKIIGALQRRTAYYFDIGDYANCLFDASYGEALTRTYIRKKMDSLEYVVYFSQMKFNVAIRTQNYDSVEIMIRQAESSKKAGGSVNMGLFYEQVGMIYMARKDFTKGKLYFKEALDYYTKEKDWINCSTVLNNMGYEYYFTQLGDPMAAISHLNEALQYANREKIRVVETKIEKANIYNHLALAYLKMGSFESALKSIQLAFDQIKVGSNETELLYAPKNEFIQIRKIDFITDLIIDKGDVYLKKYSLGKKPADLQQAIQTYKIADLFLNRIKTEQSDIQSRLFWRKANLRLYEHALEASWQENSSEDAFYFFEKGRSVLLSDQLDEQNKTSDANIYVKGQIKKKLLFLERASAQLDATSDGYLQIQHELISGNHKLDSLEQQIRLRDPTYDGGLPDTAFFNYQDLQLYLHNNNQSIIELFTGDSAVYTLMISGGRGRLHKIDKKDFDHSAKTFIELVSNPVLLNKRFPEYLKSASHLYQLIFEGDSLPAGRNIVSLAGIYFPFEALVTTYVGTVPTYYLQDHVVSYTYSAQFLLKDYAYANGQTTSGSFLGIAPVKFPSSGTTGLATLTGSDESLQRIGTYFYHPAQMIGGAANKAKFLSSFPDYRVIQLYAHSSDSGSNGEPLIYFSDSTLYLSELILEKKPSTRLVVLAACESGNGQWYQGEGVFGFNRGFAALGIPASVTNLWSTDSKSTYRISELFYKWLSAGLPTDSALQKAKWEFISASSGKTSIPSYWAAPILLGKAETIYFKRTSYWSPWAITGVLGCLSLFIAWSFHKRWGARNDGK